MSNEHQWPGSNVEDSNAQAEINLNGCPEGEHLLSEQPALCDLIAEIEYALEALEYYDDVRRHDMDEHTNNVIVLCGRALDRASRYLSRHVTDGGQP